MARSETAAFVTGRAGKCRWKLEPVDGHNQLCRPCCVFGFEFWGHQVLFLVNSPGVGGYRTQLCRFQVLDHQCQILQLLVLWGRVLGFACSSLITVEVYPLSRSNGTTHAVEGISIGMVYGGSAVRLSSLK
jgi:hypothetical protein